MSQTVALALSASTPGAAALAQSVATPGAVALALSVSPPVTYSARETAMAALMSVLAAALPAVSLTRGEGLPMALDADGNIDLEDGPEESIGYALGKGHYLELAVAAAMTWEADTWALARQGLSAFARSVAAVIEANPTLGGVVDDSRVGALEFEPPTAQDGTKPLADAILPISLYYRTNDSMMELL